MTTIPSHGAVKLDPIALAAFQRRLHGELIAPDSAAYEGARRVINQRFDRLPALIARCRTAQDVALAVSFAREQSLPIAVRSGGHSVAGHSTSAGGLLIDLSHMRRVVIDPLQRVARSGPDRAVSAAARRPW